MDTISSRLSTSLSCYEYLYQCLRGMDGGTIDWRESLKHMFRPIRERCQFVNTNGQFANINGQFASLFQFANGKDFCEHAKYLAWRG